MIFDFSQTAAELGVITFPDWVFGDLPRQGEVIETKVLRGRPAASVNVQAIADEQE